ncbi:ankyrin repeat-containing domain protein, partial [Fusarium venenatum]
MRAIQVASECEQFEVVELLIELGANIDVKDENGSPILHVVCQKGHTETMKALINAGADIEELDASGFTPLAVSCYYGHLDAANLLIGVGSDFSRIIKFHGATLLFQAVAKDYTKIARLLLDNGVDLAE